MGRARLKGKRRPDLAVVAEDPSTVRKTITLADCYTALESVASRSPRREALW